MREPRIYVDLTLEPDLRLSLPISATHHISNVLRKRIGQRISLFNGLGGSYLAEIVSIGKRHVEVRLLAFREEQRESTLHVTLAQGVSRTQHMDYTLQKAVELGVNRIVPLISEFGNVHIEDQGAEKKLQHWKKIVISACEQCGRNLVPELLSPIPLAQWLEADSNKVKLLLHPDASRGLSSIEITDQSLSILSGAQGGFSEIEVESALASDYMAIEPGPGVLRTETAAIAAISICQSRWGDMG
ncbi:MAG: 16S rRNA (uracil(1498)-N(3))-methyltransferase [Gammaproteobacteria bacterium]|nr:16S rRNA (uracil(1498)-N(3))-methyltransferase [Gammaproteobacteria bacterium]